MKIRILLAGLTFEGKQYGKGDIVESPHKRLITLTQEDLRDFGRVCEIVKEIEIVEENEIPKSLMMSEIITIGKYKKDNISWGDAIKIDRAYVKYLVKPVSRIPDDMKAQIQSLLEE